MATPGSITLQNGRDNHNTQGPTLPESGRVGNVVRQWLVYEDQMIANQIQQEEIQDHYSKNRHHRRTVREDIPVAKNLSSEEEARAQYERMRLLEEQRRIAERDRELARNLQQNITVSQREEQERKTLRDENSPEQRIRQPLYGSTPVYQARSQEFARQMQEREARIRHEHSHVMAGPQPPGARDENYYNLEPHLQQPPQRRTYGYGGGSGPTQINSPGNQTRRVGDDNSLTDHYTSDYDDLDEEALEAEDRELALRLQKDEEERYERKKQQRLLAKERRRLEQLIAQQQQVPSGGAFHNERSQEDDGDFSDFYIPPDPNMSPDESRRLQEEQDAELAKLIQDQEKKRSRNASLNERLKEIENKDAELARIIQEEENLRAKRRALKQKQKVLQQQREVAEQLASHDQVRSPTIRSTGSGGERPLLGDSSSRDNIGRERFSRDNISNAAHIATPSVRRPQEPNSLHQSNSSPTTNTRGAQFESPRGKPVMGSRAQQHQSNSPNHRSRQVEQQEGSLENNRAFKSQPTPVNDLDISSSNRTGEPPTPQARLKHSNTQQTKPPNIPIALPSRLLHNTDDGGSSESSNDRLTIRTDIPKREPMHGVRAEPRRVDMMQSPSRSDTKVNVERPVERSDMYGERSSGRGDMYAERPSGRGDMYAERPSGRGDMYAERSSGRGGHSPLRNRDSSPPGPALPERRYRDDPTTTSVNVNTNANGNSHAPPYREPRPPPYHGQSQIRLQPGSDRQPSPASPRSAETHYETPWDLSRLENQLLRGATGSQNAQPIKPVKVSPPGRRGHPGHTGQPGHPGHPGHTGHTGHPSYPVSPTKNPHVPGPGGRPLIEHTENGQIVMNIAEMIDPTYSRRQGQRPGQGERPSSQAFELSADDEITAVPGQRRPSRKGQAGAKRESCKQQ